MPQTPVVAVTTETSDTDVDDMRKQLQIMLGEEGGSAGAGARTTDGSFGAADDAGAAEEQIDFMEERLYEYESVVIKSQLKSQMLNKSNGDLCDIENNIVIIIENSISEIIDLIYNGDDLENITSLQFKIEKN